jgi:mono/diheme cytochrome c family protein
MEGTRLNRWGLAGALALAATVALGGSASAQDQVTFAEDVAVIIQENCQICHQPGGIGPMSLTNYDEIRPWAPMIREKVANSEMPPYAYDRNIGIQDLQEDWRLSVEQIETIVAWVDQGAQMGDPANLPAPISLPNPDEWRMAAQFGQPDIVVGVPDITVPASGGDVFIGPRAPTNLAMDRCIRAVQVKPAAGNARTVVHHANSTFQIQNPDGTWEQVGRSTEYAMGKFGEIIPDGVCRKITANSWVDWDIHLFPGGVGGAATGEAVQGNIVELGIWLHPEGYTAPYEQDLRSYGETSGELILPPHGTTMTVGYHSFDHPVRIDQFQPHGHLRLRHASLEIFYPETGETEVISMITNWSATWHHSHIYATDAAPLVPAGAVLITKQWYDNTADNPNNPDPDLWVLGGGRTADEMSHAWIAITHLDQAGYEQLVAERERKLAADD